MVHSMVDEMNDARSVKYGAVSLNLKTFPEKPKYGSGFARTDPYPLVLHPRGCSDCGENVIKQNGMIEKRATMYGDPEVSVGCDYGDWGRLQQMSYSF